MQEYYSETIAVAAVLIALLLLLIAGLSSELAKQKRAAKQLHDRLGDVLDKAAKAVEHEYKK